MARVRRIGRWYRPRTRAAYRVLLTRRRQIAKTWMSCDVRRDALRLIRRMTGWADVDIGRCSGGCFTVNRSDEEARLIDRLVETWSHPDRAIDGIDEIRPGVWSLSSTEIEDDLSVIGPAWLGRGASRGARRYLIGPTWCPDGAATTDDATPSARLREIKDIERGG